MRIAVSGSIATDHLMTFPGSFTDALVAEHLDRVSLSFLVDELVILRGGTAANICFGLGNLGLPSVLVGAVGADFAEYAAWLHKYRVDTRGVRTSETRHTSRFVCTTDNHQNQLASFYAGAMSETPEIELAEVAARTDGFDLVLIGPTEPAAMVRQTLECRERGYRFAADPSQQLARADGDMIKQLLDGAEYLFTNEYELKLMEQKTGWSEAELLGKVGLLVTTHGAQGVTLQRSGSEPVKVAAAEAGTVADPTGGGDAFRAGFLGGVAWGLSEERAAQVGCQLATLAIESVGGQEYGFEPAGFLVRFAKSYGDDAAADIKAHLPA